MDITSSVSQIDMDYQCGSCEHIYKTVDEFNDHDCDLNTQPFAIVPQILYQCSICGGVFKSKVLLNYHHCGALNEDTSSSSAVGGATPSRSGEAGSATTSGSATPSGEAGRATPSGETVDATTTPSSSGATGVVANWQKSETLYLISRYKDLEGKINGGKLRKNKFWRLVSGRTKYQGL